MAVLELDLVMEVLDSEAPDFYDILKSMTVVCPPAVLFDELSTTTGGGKGGVVDP